MPVMATIRLEDENTMQAACIECIKEIIIIKGVMLAQCVLRTNRIEESSPLVVQALCDAATECQWFAYEADIEEVEIARLFKAISE